MPWVISDDDARNLKHFDLCDSAIKVTKHQDMQDENGYVHQVWEYTGVRDLPRFHELKEFSPTTLDTECLGLDKVP